MRFLFTLLVCLSASVLATPPAVDSARPHHDKRDLRARRIGAKVVPWVQKMLIASDVNEAEKYRSYTDIFRLSMNYQDDPHGHEDDKLVHGLIYAPMLELDANIDTWKIRAQTAIDAGAKYILGPNEPNEYGISGAKMADLWKRAIQPLLDDNPGVKGISPAVSSRPNFVDFFKDFKDHCSSCDVYAYSIHIYGREERSVSESMEKIKEYLDEVEDAVGGNKRIWVTEFGNRAPGKLNKKEYIREAVKIFRNHPWVELCAAFPHMDNSDFVQDGVLSSLAKAWIDA